jgi:hypothetical protein
MPKLTPLETELLETLERTLPLVKCAAKQETNRPKAQSEALDKDMRRHYRSLHKTVASIIQKARKAQKEAVQMPSSQPASSLQIPIRMMALAEIVDELHQRSWAMANAPKKRDETNEYSMKLLTPHMTRRGRTVLVRYANEEYEPLTDEEARRYLQWLRNGNVGTHRDARRFFQATG